MQKISETNHEDNFSRALNVSIQNMVSALLSKPKLDKPEKFDGIEFQEVGT